MWCHNPESQSIQPQIIRSPTGERVAGREYTASELAALLNQQAAILRANEGGITFSGGEPLFQAEFVAEVIDLLDDMHVVLDTCGHAPQADFLLVLARSDLVFYDLKADRPAGAPALHRYDNDLILDNLQLLGESGKPFIIRVPLVPGVTDTDENLAGIARTVEKMPGLVEVDLLPYNRAAGAKYRYAGMEFKPDYDETRPVEFQYEDFRASRVKGEKRMNERLVLLKQRMRAGEHKVLRQAHSIELLPECEDEGLSWPRRVARLVRRQCEAEQVVIAPEEKIVFTRTLPGVPPVYTPEEWSQPDGRDGLCTSLDRSATSARIGACCSRKGCSAAGKWRQLHACAWRITRKQWSSSTAPSKPSMPCWIWPARYARQACQLGREELAEVLEAVPAQPARTFREALQSLRLCQAVVWLGGNYHVGLGRFDQYMWPYLQADLQAGRLTVTEAEELLAEFFISLNKDSDLYPGVQQGDNGQSAHPGRGQTGRLSRGQRADPHGAAGLARPGADRPEDQPAHLVHRPTWSCCAWPAN